MIFVELECIKEEIERIDDCRRKKVAERDAAINYWHKTLGESIAELSRATGLSRTMLYKILDKEKRG